MQDIYISYSRVSTKEQASQGASIEAQIQEHKDYASSHGFTISKFYSDEGYSAGSFDRPALQEMIKFVAQNKKVNGKYPYNIHLLIRYQNRLIRDIAKKRSLQAVFKTYNINVICLNGRWEGTPIDGGLATDIQMIFDENERTQISPRVIASYKRIAEDGFYPFGGPAPIGYTKVNIGNRVKLKKDPDRADMIEQIFKIMALNKYTLVELIEYLNSINALGIYWHKNKMWHLINNPLYYGRFVTKWFDSEESDHIGPYWHSHEAHTEPIVSKELFEKVQKACHYSKIKEYHYYPFKGKVKCSICGEWMGLESVYKVAKGRKKLYQYYRCSHCNKRINQNFIRQYIVTHHPKLDVPKGNQDEIKRLKRIIAQKKRSIEITEKYFEDGLMDEDEYSLQYSNSLKNIKEAKKLLRKIVNAVQRNFNRMSEEEQKSLIFRTVKEIIVQPGPINKEAEVKAVIYQNEDPMKS